ncbi:MAG: histidine kinase [Candidatus Moduliflexus flocculans]|nr:histidine kinase [Candidatus Moduliflexus flocculans]
MSAVASLCVESFEAYIAAVDKEFDHIKKGEIQQAKWHDQRQVAPVFNKLKRALRENEIRCEAYSRAFSRWDTWGTLAALLIASGVIMLLLQHFLSAQELAVRSAADQRVIEVYKHTEAEIRQMNENLEWRAQQRTSELRAANEKLEKEMAERRRLEAMVQEISEMEKLRLGQDLHDGVGQILTGAAMRSKALENRLREKVLLEANDVSQVTQLIGEALRLTRNLAGLLYPVELGEERIGAGHPRISGENTKPVRCRLFLPGERLHPNQEYGS